jgi:hypothetical protein
LPKSGLIRPAMSLTRVRGEFIEPPRLAFHPADASRVLSGRHETPTATPGRAHETRTGTAIHREGFGRSRWLLGAGGALILVALIAQWQWKRDSVSDFAGAPGADSTTHVLESLIANRLPIVEEALALPHESQIFGRPLLESPYRRDKAHALCGPHFITNRRRPAQAPTMSDRLVRHPASASKSRDFRVDPAHPPTGVGAFDRALAALHGVEP